jgi:membrane-bound lytic murein transglycosylase D
LKYIIYFILTILIVITVNSCQKGTVKKDIARYQYVPEDFPEDLWVSENVRQKLDSLFIYQREAQKKLIEEDTLGAEIYFNSGFALMTDLTDEDLNMLQEWSVYDSTLQVMNHEYNEIYNPIEDELEAEEVRQDISQLEEIFSIPDSVLFGDAVVVDTSGEIPITLNRKVRLAMKYFQTKGRRVFTKWLENSERYRPVVYDVFEEEGVPHDLYYLAMIESGFNPHARSYARAVGMWQFISATGRYYGLRHNWWFDERRDVYKASRAAAQHLSDLHDRFGDWYLALAGYNCNPRKVEKNMRRYHTTDFWQLKRLPRQTRNYVPTYLAAMIIAKNPEKFGFYVDPKPPVEVEPVTMSESVDLNVIAQIVDTSYAYIKDINPAVLRWVTPPGVKDFTVYVPKGKKQLFEEQYAKIPDEKKRSWVRHRIRSGETLSTIAQKYHTNIAVIKSTNHLQSSRIRAGHYLLIPVPQNKYHYAYQDNTYTSKSRKKRHYSSKKITNVPGHKKIIYTVKPGDTLGQIAEDYNTYASKIRRWNGIRYGKYIYPKQKLAIWIPEKVTLTDQIVKEHSKPVVNYSSGEYYTVRNGDTLWDIAKKYGLSIKELKNINNMRSSLIKPGDKIKISDE